MRKTPKLISFDFDGVFVRDSDAVYKKEAWGIAFRDYSGYEPFLAEGNNLYGHGKKGGRTEIMRHIFQRLGKSEEEIPVLIESTAAVFDEYVQACILKTGLVPGAREGLEAVIKLGIPLYLNSGTATGALKRSAKNLNIEHFFAAILGSTPEPLGGSKVENLSYFAQKERAAPQEILFIGDGETDFKAAKEFGCRFVGVANIWNKWHGTMQPFHLITSLQEIEDYL